MLELFCPTCKRFSKSDISKANRHLLQCLSCNTEYSLSDSNIAMFDSTEPIKRKAYRRKMLDTKVATICCSVRIRYKQAILEYADREDGSVANVVGKILEKWVDDNNLLKPVEPTVQDEFEFKEDD